MIRRTSIETYNEIKDNGLLGRLQFLVYDAIYKRGPLTQNELHRWCFAHTQPRNVQPRVSELVDLGVVAGVGERECSITGRMCIIWDVTDRLPVHVEKKKSKDQIIRELQAENIQLRGKVAELLRSRFSGGQGELF